MLDGVTGFLMQPSFVFRPTRAQVEAARDHTIPDVIAPRLGAWFCGINPSLYSAAVGHHFARPGNRFWKALHAAGLTQRILSPFEDHDLLGLGLGLTNLVARATARADELEEWELREGARLLEEKARSWRPRIVAFLGMTAYRAAFGRPRAEVGPQAETLGESQIWLLPNPSGLNAHYQVADLGRVFGGLREALDIPGPDR